LETPEAPWSIEPELIEAAWDHIWPAIQAWSETPDGEPVGVFNDRAGLPMLDFISWQMTPDQYKIDRCRPHLRGGRCRS